MQTRSSSIPVNTAMSEDTFFKYLDDKFESLRSSFIEEIKKEILTEVKALIQERDNKIIELESTVSMLQTHVSNLKHSYDKSIEELEQYGRHQCLRMEGVPMKKEETADEVLDFVSEKIKEIGVNVPDVILDRAHRVGKPYKDRESGIMLQSILVKFTTFRHRTLLYKNRKKLGDNVTLRLDLTRARYILLSEGRRFVDKYKDKVKFVYADINCRLKVHFNTGPDQFFESLDDLDHMVKES